MDIYTKFELLKYAKHFLIRQKPQIAKTFLEQIIKRTSNKQEKIMLNELVECLEKNVSTSRTIIEEKINKILDNKKNYPIFASMDNSPKLILE